MKWPEEIWSFSSRRSELFESVHWVVIVSDNDLAPVQYKAITRTKAYLLVDT